MIFVWNVFKKKKKHDIAREIKITKGDVAFLKKEGYIKKIDNQ